MRSFWQPRWQLGFLKTSLADTVAGENLDFVWIENPYQDGWMADPFVLEVSDSTVDLLVEDFRYADRKGRISKVVVDRRTNEIVRRKVLLDDGHYSFPAVLRADDEKIFVYPEQSRQGRLDLFEYDAEREACQLVETLRDEPLTDAIIYKGVVFSTAMPEPNGTILNAFPWRQELCSGMSFEDKIVFDECIARNAGNFFEVDGMVYRPAQECNRWYGNAVSIQRFADGKFTEVRRISGIHTLNSYKGVTVVDRKIFPLKWIYRMLGKSDK